MVETIKKSILRHRPYDQTFWRSVLGTLVGGCARIGKGQSALLIDLEPIHDSRLRKSPLEFCPKEQLIN